MNFWGSFPFVRYAMWLMAGILLAMSTDYNCAFTWHIVLMLSFCCIGGYLAKNKIPNFLLVQGFLGAALLFSFGYALTREQQASAQIKDLPEQEAYWLVEALTEGSETPKTIKLEAQIHALKSEKGWEKSNGKLMLYLKKEQLERIPQYGASFVLKARINEVPAPLNPSAFNYKGYLATKGIAYQTFVAAENIVFTADDPQYPFIARATGIRNSSSATIQKWIKDRQEASIIKALVLGAKDSLDEEIKQAYATAGAMHVLAVSGLHVGFIYLLLNFLLRYWRSNPYLKWLSFILVLGVLWSYAILTGLSPSVIRAAWMFSMLDLALKMKRKSGTYNTLAVAAFALLLFNPYNIKAVGFQLSFLAVAGIVYMAPRLNAFYNAKNKILRYGWGLLTVSIAAQLATFPLGLYYFGQFPTYFFITNLLVVPAAGFILALGFLLLFFNLFSNVLAAATGWCLYALMRFVNGFVFFAEGLPLSKLSGSIDGIQLFLIMGIIVGLLLLLNKQKLGYAAVFFLFTGLFIGNLFYVSWERKKQKKLIVYHIPAYTSIQLIEGDKEFFLKDEQLPPEQLQFQVQPHRAALGFGKLWGDEELRNSFAPAIHQEESYTLISWRGISLLHLYGPFTGFCEEEGPVKVDYLLIGQGSINSLKELSSCFKAKEMIIDGSNRYYQVERLRQEAEEMDLLYHITAEKGAFELVISRE